METKTIGGRTYYLESRNHPHYIAYSKAIKLRRLGWSVRLIKEGTGTAIYRAERKRSRK